MKAIPAAVITTVLLTGCAQQAFTVKDNHPSAPPRQTTTHHFFLYGLVSKNRLMQHLSVAVWIKGAVLKYSKCFLTACLLM